MRHGKAGKAFGRRTMWRAATVRDLARSVIIHQRICTTVARAKEARKLVDRIISLGKEATLSARRRAFSILCDHKLVKRLFTEIAPLFKNRPGGYTRIIPLSVHRRGDNAAMVFLELTEKKVQQATKKAGKKLSKDSKESSVEDATVVQETHDSSKAEPKKKEAPRQKREDLKGSKPIKEKSAKPSLGAIKNIFRNKKPE